METPDIDLMLSLIDKIRELSLKKNELQNRIKEAEASIFKEATTNTAYYVGGKPPSQASIENTFQYTGFNNELVPIRLEVSNLDAEIRYHTDRLVLLKESIGVWRTLQASERNLVL